MEFASLNGSEKDNHYPYGTAEHLAFDLNQQFGKSLSSFVLSVCYREPGIRIEEFLDGVLTLFGVEAGQYCALYLRKFETMPQLMDATRERIVLMNLDFDIETDPDLKRWAEE